MSRGLLIAALTLGACANNVSQSAHSGPDNSWKNPKELTLINGEVRTTGIVTYPGGDRADWKSVEIPDKQVGLLELKLTWKVPRPGLQLGFEVYDQYYWDIYKSKASGRKKRTYLREGQIDHAKGKYFIRVYAVGRGDAGSYTLNVNFTPDADIIILKPEDIPVSDPPKLAEVPAVVEPCTDENFNKDKKECQNYCPKTRSLAPDSWAACAGPDKAKCPTPAVNTDIKCWRDDTIRPTLTCPSPWLSQLKQWCPPPTVCPNPPDYSIPACVQQPFTTRVSAKTVNGTDTIVTVGGGKSKGITPDWKPVLLRGNTNTPYSGGEGTIVRVDTGTTTIKFRLTIDVITENPNIKMVPPPPPR